MITCRVCAAKSNPFDDAVLVCGDCRNQSHLLAGHIEATKRAAVECAADLLMQLTPTDIRRAQTVTAAYFAAKRAGTMATWERRIQRTIDNEPGTAFTAYLEAELALYRTRIWADVALEELSALADEPMFQEAA
jgi:hypothetical protein